MTGTVLVVEDESDLADLYVEQLSDSFTTAVAYSGERALDVVDARDAEIGRRCEGKMLPSCRASRHAMQRDAREGI